MSTVKLGVLLSRVPAPENSSSPLRSNRMPVMGLVALGTAGFITMTTEAIPAGLLPQISATFGVPEAVTGQMVSAYGLSTALFAIPLAAVTRKVPRRFLVLLAIFGFFIANTLTAVSPNFWFTFSARIIAGACAGLMWTLIASIALRISPPEKHGTALTIATLGTPLALALGVPAGTFIGQLVGWQGAFILLSALTLCVAVWLRFTIPPLPPQKQEKHATLKAVIMRTGVRRVLLVTAMFAIAQNVFFTYFAPYLTGYNLQENIAGFLFIFGLSTVVGLMIAGRRIDKALTQTKLIAVGILTLSFLLFSFGGNIPWLIWITCALWGLAFGAIPTLLVASTARSAGHDADTAQAALVTILNAAVAVGAALGGVVLHWGGSTIIPIVATLVSFIGLCLVVERPTVRRTVSEK